MEKYKVIYKDEYLNSNSMPDITEDILNKEELEIVIKRENFEYEFKYPDFEKSVSFVSGYSDDEIKVTITITRIE